MVDTATITLAIQGIKYAGKALELGLTAKAGALAKEKVEEAKEQLGQALDVIYQMREELVRQQDENIQLKAKLRTHEDWEVKCRPYALSQTPGGAVVYKATEPFEHYICPSCYDKRQHQILQDLRAVSGQFECPSCDSTYSINERTKVNIPRRRGSGFI